MSVHAMAWAFDQQCPPISRFVLVTLADHADETGRCYPSLTRIMTRTGLSRDAVCRHLADLEASGYISRDRGHALSRTSTVYTLKQYAGKTSPRERLVLEKDSKQYARKTQAVREKDQNHQEPKQEPKHRATTLREGQEITETQRAFAVTLGVNPATEWPLFVDYWVGTGKPMKDWDATWRNWCRRSLTFAVSKGRVPAPRRSAALPPLPPSTDPYSYIDAEGLWHDVVDGRDLVCGPADDIRPTRSPMGLRALRSLVRPLTGDTRDALV